jgi:pimeloyl-ACP methyl ester carboxylesterase
MSSIFVESSQLPVLVLLHGATGNGRMWDPIRRILEPRGYRVLAPDLPGHGARRDQRFRLEAAVQVVAETVRSVAPAPVLVAGDSLGGYVSMAAAAALPPERLVGVVASGCTLVFEGNALWPLRIKGLVNRLLVAVVGEKRLLGKRFVAELGKLGVAEADAHALIDAGVNIAAFGDCVAALTGVDFPAKLAPVKAPVLFVNGGADKPMLRDLARYRAAVPAARHELFPGVEHGVSLRKSAEFADLVDDFARKPV